MPSIDGIATKWYIILQGIATVTTDQWNALQFLIRILTLEINSAWQLGILFDRIIFVFRHLKNVLLLSVFISANKKCSQLRTDSARERGQLCSIACAFKSSLWNWSGLIGFLTIHLAPDRHAIFLLENRQVIITGFWGVDKAHHFFLFS